MIDPEFDIHTNLCAVCNMDAGYGHFHFDEDVIPCCQECNDSGRIREIATEPPMYEMFYDFVSLPYGTEGH